LGVSATPATGLRDGDRVELLRGLQTDPKQARRLRAQRSIPPMQK
jgi:putative ubiquitin-RnfH superfamily antitoxin RatB of RatAB toxin-antitoxin module